MQKLPIALPTAHAQISFFNPPFPAPYFQKNSGGHKRSSPRIKASLSYAAIESLKAQQQPPMTAVASVRRGLRRSHHVNDENATPSASDLHPQYPRAGRAVPKIIVPSSARKSKSATSLKNPKCMAIGPAANARRGGALVKVSEENNFGHKRATFSSSSSTSSMRGHVRVRGRTKSWGQLTALASSEAALATPRYMTRSKAKKISKSMSDLVQL